MSQGEVLRVIDLWHQSESTAIRKDSQRMVELLTALKNEEEKIREGGGAKAIDSTPNRLTAPKHRRVSIPERFLRTRHLPGPGKCTKSGAAPRSRHRYGSRAASWRMFMIIANDATVKAGAFFPMTAKKSHPRAECRRRESHPHHLSGRFRRRLLPLQEDVFPDTDDFGRVFRNNAVMSAQGIPQITAIMGMCVAGGVYSPRHVRSAF